MPSRILGFDFSRRSSPPTDAIQQQTNNKLAIPVVTELKPNSSMDHIKRPTIAGLSKRYHSGEKDKRKGSKERSDSKDKQAKEASRHAPPPAKPVKLEMFMESPPVLFLDPPQVSSGALLSGRLQVTPNFGDVEMEHITMFLEATVATKKPVVDRCRECSTQVKDLYEWNFFKHPKLFKASEGMQELPFSHLIPGHLPSTTHGQVGSMDYSLHVRAKSSDGQETEFRRELVIRRALRPGADKNSIRVFPPTNLTLNVTLPSVVHPIGSFPVYCRMLGITTKREDTQTRWRLRKLTWRIEETETNVSPACAKHSAKVGGEGKGILNENKRDIGVQELREGFKTDFDDGQIEGEFEASIDVNTKPQCDVDSPNGLKITHSLIMELVIAEEWAPNKKPTQATPTGAARVLRTQFNLYVTERQGMGISWDDEAPPMYEDVPASPPHYATGSTTVSNYEGNVEELHRDVDSLQLDRREGGY